MSKEFGKNIIELKSFSFGVRIVKLYKFLIKKDRYLEPIFKQLLKSGTSIGANVSESQSAYSKKDFINKLGIALKEAKETEYWLRLLKECAILSIKEFDSLYKDCIELLKIMTSIIKSSKLKP